MAQIGSGDHKLYLLRNGDIIRSYDIVMDAHWDAGHKTQERDERTPEGRYVIDWRNAESVAHLSLHISYPDADDVSAAHAAGVDPGGNIMIHGLPNGWGALAPLHLLIYWTDGCIAITNVQMQQIWALVPDGTPIDIAARWRPGDDTGGWQEQTGDAKPEMHRVRWRVEDRGDARGHGPWHLPSLWGGIFA